MSWSNYSSRIKKNSLVTKSFRIALGVWKNIWSSLLDPDESHSPISLEIART
jgi:hypothetical protein